MKTSSAKEKILQRIRIGLQNPLPLPFPEREKTPYASLFTASLKSLEEEFADAFIQLGGRFIYCVTHQDLIQQIHQLYDTRSWQQLLCSDPVLLSQLHSGGLDFITAAERSKDGADACITGCEFLIARTGSFILSSAQPMGRVAPVFFPVHIVVAYTHQLVRDIGQGIEAMQHKYPNQWPSMINLNTGPSRTADIEKTLVVGVHGPKEVFCFLLQSDAGEYH